MQWIRTTMGIGVFNRQATGKAASGEKAAAPKLRPENAIFDDVKGGQNSAKSQVKLFMGQASWAVTRTMKQLEQEQLSHKQIEYSEQPLDTVQLEELIGQESEQFMYQDLVKAVRRNDARGVLGYLEKNSKLNRSTLEGQSLLHVALDADAVDVAAVLLDQGSDPNEFDETTGEYPIHKACNHQNQEAICELIKNGAELNVYNREGKTPLLLTIQHRNADLAHLEMESGADPQKPDEFTGNTPLHQAVKVASDGIVNDLLGRKINPNAQNESGSTPLHNAICYAIRDNQENRLHIINALLTGGADLYVTDRNNDTVLDVVKKVLTCREPGFKTPFVQILSQCSTPVTRADLRNKIQSWLDRKNSDYPR